MTFKTNYLAFRGLALLLVGCNKDDDTDESDAAFGKNTKYYVEYTLDSEEHRYDRSTGHHPIFGSSSISHTHDFDFGLGTLD